MTLDNTVNDGSGGGSGNPDDLLSDDELFDSVIDDVKGDESKSDDDEDDAKKSDDKKPLEDIEDEDDKEDEDSEDDEDGDDEDDEEEKDSNKEDVDDLEDPALDENIKTGLKNSRIFGELKKDYPDIFKKHPELRAIIGNEQQLSEHFPTLESAEEAVEAVSNFNKIRESALSGDPRTILGELAKADENAFVKFTSNILPALLDGAPKLYAQVTAPVLARALKNIKQSAVDSKNKNLYLAYQHISKHLFNSAETPDFEFGSLDKDGKDDKDKKDDTVSQVEGSFIRDTLDTGERITLQIIKKDLDPNKVMTPKMFEAVAADIFRECNEIIKTDKRFAAQRQALWAEAKSKGYGRDASDRIIRAWLARVKPLIPSVRQKVSAEYLGDKRNKAELKKGKSHIPQSGGSNSDGSTKRDKDSKRILNPKDVDFRNTSDEDLFEDKVTPKKRK
jgi:hypothetical protein